MGAWARTLMPALPVVLIAGALAAGPAAAEDRLEPVVPGTSVKIEGPVTVGGIAPFPLGELPPGHYLLRAEGPGLARAVGRMRRDAAGGLSMGRAAGLESFLYPPGFSHFRVGESSRGFLFLGTGTMGLAGNVIQQFEVNDAEDEVSRARARYDAAVSVGEIDRARLDLLAANDRIADEKDLRTIWTAYLGVAWIGAAVENWLLTPRPGLTPEGDGVYRLDVPPAGGFSAALRSVLVPGAGQRFLGHQARGNRFTAAVMLLGAGSIVAHDAFLNARREQNDAQRRYEIAETVSEIERWRGELEDASSRATDRNRLRWGLVGVTVGVYLWNVVDAGTLGSEASVPAPVSLSIDPRPDGLRAGLTWRIS